MFQLMLNCRFTSAANLLGKTILKEEVILPLAPSLSNNCYDLCSQSQLGEQRTIPKECPPLLSPQLQLQRGTNNHQPFYSCVPSYLMSASSPEIVAAQNNSHNVLADIMYISLHSCQYYCTLVRILEVEEITRVILLISLGMSEHILQQCNPNP